MHYRFSLPFISLLIIAFYGLTQLFSSHHLVFADNASSIPLRGPGRVFAVVAGIGRYRNPEISRLVSPPHDAQLISRYLLAPNHADTQIFIDKQATRENILNAIARVARKIMPEDSFILYFSGHGGSELSDKDVNTWIDYLQPYDSDPSNYRKDISDFDLLAQLLQLPNQQHITIILDSCYSGGFFSGKQVMNGKRKFDSTARFNLLSGTGYTLLAAANYNEVSVDSDDGSLFTYNLIEGLRDHREKVDTNHDHQITAQELFDYAAPRTITDAQEYKEQQHPQVLIGSNPILLTY